MDFGCFTRIVVNEYVMVVWLIRVVSGVEKGVWAERGCMSGGCVIKNESVPWWPVR